jgi:tRNA pseudouridine55 synthase
MPNGLLNLNKPSGPTSRQVVDVVQRLARPAKAGHAGTLDPLASGVLVVGVGAGTRLVDYVQRMPKRYRGTFLLGRRSPTEDIQGEVTLLEGGPLPAVEQIRAAAGALLGQIQQRPPAYSALKLAGRRAYELARQGHQVELAARPVTVYAIEVSRYEYPELVLEVECSRGTYVRSLGRDLARSLGTEAVMSALVRWGVGPFRLEDAADPGLLTCENLAGHLLPMLRAVETLPRVVLSADQIGRVRNGLAVAREPPAPEAGEIAAVDARGRLVAILCPRGQGLLGPLRNLATE